VKAAPYREHRGHGISTAMLTGKWFDETKVGDTFDASITVTETHLVLAAGLFGDFNPLHVDDELARKSRFGGRIVHGALTSALISAPAGMYFHGTAIAYLEHNCRFKAPVRPGDTLRTIWTITERMEKPQHGGGIVVMRARCENHRGEVVAEADGKMLVANGR
jgi:3-hydroxybutyryl-CoA dehydratase